MYSISEHHVWMYQLSRWFHEGLPSFTVDRVIIFRFLIRTEKSSNGNNNFRFKRRNTSPMCFCFIETITLRETSPHTHHKSENSCQSCVQSEPQTQIEKVSNDLTSRMWLGENKWYHHDLCCFRVSTSVGGYENIHSSICRRWFSRSTWERMKPKYENHIWPFCDILKRTCVHPHRKTHISYVTRYGTFKTPNS